MEKSFWKRPEGATGAVFLAAIVGGGLWLLYSMLPTLIVLAQNTLYLAGMLAALGALLFVVLDPKARNLVWYAYKSVMRWVTGIFVQIDPIGILKSYLEELEDNLRKMSKQIGSLRGQMRQLKGTMEQNEAEIRKNMGLAEQAKKKGDEKNIALAARKAGRLQEVNAKYDVLYKKMDVLYRLLTKMYENSEIVWEDTKDQVKVKEQEYQAIRTSHGAIRSAMSVISGDPDKRAMFDQALEAMADELGQKVGEMERFMDTSRHLMDTIDLQNGTFEDEGLRMLEQLEKTNPLLATPKGSRAAAHATEKPLDLNQPPKQIVKEENDYTRLFD
ncbi:MAG: PspA/IM30 family protein [Saprospiraceae bacterium]